MIARAPCRNLQGQAGLRMFGPLNTEVIVDNLED